MELSIDEKVELLNEKILMLNKAEIKSSSIITDARENDAYFLTRLILNTKIMMPEIISIGINENNDFTLNGEMIDRDYLAHLINSTSDYYSEPLQRGLINFSRSAISASQLLVEYDEENSSDEQKEELSEILYDCDRTRNYINRLGFERHINQEMQNELKILDPSFNMLDDYLETDSETSFIKTLKSVINNPKQCYLLIHSRLYNNLIIYFTRRLQTMASSTQEVQFTNSNSVKALINSLQEKNLDVVFGKDADGNTLVYELYAANESKYEDQPHLRVKTMYDSGMALSELYNLEGGLMSSELYIDEI